MKVFCIGFNKTGTTSLHEWFTLAGLDSCHDATYQKRTRTMEPAALRTYLDAHDAFSDGSRANVPLLLEMYPDARFVLNTRQLQAWLESRVTHVFRQGGVALAEPEGVGGQLRPGLWSGGMAQEYLRDSAQAISDWIDRREFFHRSVLGLFANDASRHLLVLNVTGNPDWPTELASFLDIPAPHPSGAGIHANQATADPDRFDLTARLHEIETVLSHKAIPPAEWQSEVYVGFRASA